MNSVIQSNIFKHHQHVPQNQRVLVRPGSAVVQSPRGNQTSGPPCRNGRRAAPSPSPSAPAAPSSSWTPPSPPSPSPPAAGPAGGGALGVSARPPPWPAGSSSGSSAAPPQPGAGALPPAGAIAWRRGKRSKDRFTEADRKLFFTFLLFLSELRFK